MVDAVFVINQEPICKCPRAERAPSGRAVSTDLLPFTRPSVPRIVFFEVFWFWCFLFVSGGILHVLFLFEAFFFLSGYTACQIPNPTVAHGPLPAWGPDGGLFIPKIQRGCFIPDSGGQPPVISE